MTSPSLGLAFSAVVGAQSLGKERLMTTREIIWYTLSRALVLALVFFLPLFI